MDTIFKQWILLFYWSSPWVSRPILIKALCLRLKSKNIPGKHMSSDNDYGDDDDDDDDGGDDDDDDDDRIS